MTELISDFVVMRAEYEPLLTKELAFRYSTCLESKLREILFKIIYQFIKTDPTSYVSILGSVPLFQSVDLSGMDLSGLPLKNGKIEDCVALDTDFRKTDLRKSTFHNTILDRVMFDEALITNTDFRQTELVSIYVFDEFKTGTTALLQGKDARQWLYSQGALVHPTTDLNPLMGQPWYEAAREVTRTLEHRIAGSHQDTSLSKGTKPHHRDFAKDFVGFLVSKNILLRGKKSKTGSGWLVKVNANYRQLIHDFSIDGKIAAELEPFFRKHLPSDAKVNFREM